MRFLIFLFCFLTFFFHLPVFSFHSFLLRWIIMMHTHTHVYRKTLLSRCRHKSVIDCSSTVCMCVYCSGSRGELFSVCPYRQCALLRRSQLSVHVWRWSCVREWTSEWGEETIRDNWRINVVLMLIARSLVSILLVSNHVYFVDPISNIKRSIIVCCF